MNYFNSDQTNYRLTQCCQFHDKKLAKQYNFGTTTKTYALKADGKKKVQTKALENCNKLLSVLTNYFSKQPVNLRSFRISSDLLPCYTLDFTADWYDEIAEPISKILERAGAVAKENNIRLSVHPSQFTVLGSNSPDVVKNAIRDLEYQCLFGKLMNIEAKDFVMNIHLQGLYGGKHEDGITRFATNYSYLSDYAQQCLAVENEDKPNGYDIEHTLELAQRIPIRCTLDTHHYSCHRMTETERVVFSGALLNRKIRNVKHITVHDDYFKEAVKTWKDSRPLFHVSQSFKPTIADYWMKPNAHCEVFWDEELMSLHVPMLEYADFDIEAKHKEVAVEHFYKYVKSEEHFAGESLVCKTII